MADVVVSTQIPVIAPSKQYAVVALGTQGVKGQDGASMSAFEFVQNTPLSTITCNHNLGFRPNVSVKTLGGQEVGAEVLHINTNQVQVIFDTPRTAIINCS